MSLTERATAALQLSSRAVSVALKTVHSKFKLDEKTGKRKSSKKRKNKSQSNESNENVTNSPSDIGCLTESGEESDKISFGEETSEAERHKIKSTS